MGCRNAYLKPALALSKTGRIGVMATRSTLASARFRALLASQAARASFVVQACDGLADAIERSAETGDTTETIALCTRYIRAIGKFGTKQGQIDTLVLGCTHYPFASVQLRDLLGPQVQIIDNGEAIARQTRRRVASAAAHESGAWPAAEGSVSLFTTGQPQALQAAASRWLGLTATVKTLYI